MLCVPSTPYPHCSAWLRYQGGQLSIFLLRLGKEFHSLRETARGAQTQAPRDSPLSPVGLRLRPTLEPLCEVGGARSAPAQPPSAAGSSFFGALELTLGGQGHVGAMAHGASSTAISFRGLLSSKNRRGRALVGTIDREIPLWRSHGVGYSGPGCQ